MSKEIINNTEDDVDEYKSLENSNNWADFYSSNRNYFGVTEKFKVLQNSKIIGKEGYIFCDDNLADHVLHELYYWTPKHIPGETLESKHFLTLELLNRKEQYLKNLAGIKEQNLITSVVLKKAIYLLHPFGWYAFGHLNDTLTKIKNFPDLEMSHDIPILVSNHEKITDFELHLEILLGYQPKLIKYDNTSVYSVEELYFPFSDSVYTTLTKENFVWLREKYLKYFKIKDNIIDKKNFKLYLSRNHVSKGRRSIVNESEYIDELIDSGFTILKGDEPLSAIVEYFYNAEIIVGYHGSLFANTFFCKQDCKIIEFCAKNREDHSFHFKLKLPKNYKFILVDADENFNTIICPKDLKSLIEN